MKDEKKWVLYINEEKKDFKALETIPILTILPKNEYKLFGFQMKKNL